MQQEGRRSGSALDVGGSSFAGASSLSAAPACGQEAERTTTVPGYAGASMNTHDLRQKARKLGVRVKDAGKKYRGRSEIEEDCRLALEDNLGKRKAKDKLRQ